MLRATRIHDPDLEQQSPLARDAYLACRLRETVPRAAAASAHLRERLAAAGLSPEDVRSPSDLGRKDALPALQAERPPFGDLLGVPPGRLARIFMSPGPIYDPQGEGEDFWRFRHALAAAGFRAGEVAHNAASYHLTPLGFMLDAAARALGCAVRLQ